MATPEDVVSIEDYTKALQTIRDWYEEPYKKQLQQLADILGCDTKHVYGEVVMLKARDMNHEAGYYGPGEGDRAVSAGCLSEAGEMDTAEFRGAMGGD